jgi:hypothetical protein
MLAYICALLPTSTVVLAMKQMAMPGVTLKPILPPYLTQQSRLHHSIALDHDHQKRNAARQLCFQRTPAQRRYPPYNIKHLLNSKSYLLLAVQVHLVAQLHNNCSGNNVAIGIPFAFATISWFAQSDNSA